ncbi:MAG: glycosyltransferase [Pseudomonadota bacterium]
MTSIRKKVLAIVSTYKWTHTDYLASLQAHVDLTVVYAREAHQGSVANAARWGIDARCIGSAEGPSAAETERALRSLIEKVRPDIVHLMYYLHERMTLMVREVAASDVKVVFECRDPLTTLSGAQPNSDTWRLERDAVCAADAWIFVSGALQRYLERSHGLDLSQNSLIVPHAFARRNAGPVREKHSASDSRVHIALVGTAGPAPNDGRWYGDIIQRLLKLGLVVHSHFHEWEGLDLGAYRQLAQQHPDYHFHEAVPFRDGHRLSDITSRYDLMGVFHELQAENRNESATLEVCLPTKAVSGWLHGAIPVVCPNSYRGIADYIEELGTGFLVNEIEDLAAIIARPKQIAAATAACAEYRERFTLEYHAARIAAFYRGV